MIFADGKLEDLKIETDTATAVQVADRGGEEQSSPIEFRKIDGRWFLHLPDDDQSM